MRATYGLLLGFLLCAPLCAREQGDYAPRGALAYARIGDAQNVLKKLGGGDDYLAPLERAWQSARGRDAEEMQPLVDEIRPYIKAARSIEFALGDIMVREPYTQTVTVIDLGEGAPEEFSENIRNWARKEFGKKALIEPKAMDLEAFSFRRYEGQLVIATGGMMKFVEDVRAGNLGESLSQVKRFKEWRENATGDLVAFLDGKAWRNCIDRLGNKEVDRDFLSLMTICEWQKWDMLTLSLDVQNGIALRADLTLSEAAGPISAMLKGAGGFSLFDSLPAETLAALAFQLGSDHERTYTELLKFFHDADSRMRSGSLQEQLKWYQSYIDEAEQNLKKAESDEDKKIFQEMIEQYKAEIERLNKEIAKSSDTPRAFEPDRAERRRKELRSSEAEQFHDEFENFCKESGLTRESLFAALGSEAVVGIVGLPDPMPDDDDIDIFQHMWFVAARAQGDLKAIKEKFLEMLNRERRPREPGEELPKLATKPVEGGELLGVEEGPGVTLFLGEGIVGMAANSEVAKRVLLSNSGRERLNMSKVPGGTPAGSKAGYLDLGEVLGRMLDGSMVRSRRYGNPPFPMENVRKYLKSGLRISAATNEGSSRISLTAQTGGETSARNVLETLAETLEFERAWRHDRIEVEWLGSVCEDWLRNNQAKLKEMSDGDRRDALKAVTLETLLAKASGANDGLRSAFDPAMADRFKAMLASRSDKLGEKAADFSACGFEWFGLPLDEKMIRSDDERGYGGITDAWLVAASKGSWVANGRICLIQSGMNFRTVWLSEDDFSALKLSNVSGGRLKTFKPKVEQPLWKSKHRLWRMRWDAQNVQRALVQALQQEDGTFREFSFKGADHDNAVKALLEALKLSEEDFYFNLETVSRVEIEAKDKSCKVRIVMDGQWIEIDEKGKVTTSWGNE